MTQPRDVPHDVPRGDEGRDFSRATEEIKRRLLSRGIEIHDADTPDDLVRMMDAVEEFERAVMAHGGDLMVDEPPPNGAGQPDDPHFLLPLRVAGESAAAYVSRLAAATNVVQHHPRLT
jgi:hypothetical protein